MTAPVWGPPSPPPCHMVPAGRAVASHGPHTAPVASPSCFRAAWHLLNPLAIWGRSSLLRDLHLRSVLSGRRRATAAGCTEHHSFLLTKAGAQAFSQWGEAVAPQTYIAPFNAAVEAPPHDARFHGPQRDQHAASGTGTSCGSPSRVHESVLCRVLRRGPVARALAL